MRQSLCAAKASSASVLFNKPGAVFTPQSMQCQLSGMMRLGIGSPADEAGSVFRAANFSALSLYPIAVGPPRADTGPEPDVSDWPEAAVAALQRYVRS